MTTEPSKLESDLSPMWQDAKRKGAEEACASLMKIVNEQAEDEGLWCIAERIGEAYLQQELRRLHAEIERIVRGKE